MSKTDSENEFQIVVPGDPRSLALVRSFIRNLALTAGFGDVDSSKIEVAVDEACANIIEHAYSGLEKKPPVTVQVVVSDDSFAVQILDEGKSFDLASYHAPTFPAHWNEGNVRGTGVYLIESCMDTVQFGKSDGKQNQLLMVKKRPHPVT